MVRKPSWHKLEHAVLAESPKSWEEARELAGLTWDVSTEPVYKKVITYAHHTHTLECNIEECEVVDDFDVAYERIDGYQELSRDDNGFTLSVQPTSYEVIRNERFGNVIDALLGIEDDERVEFEAIFSLYGGRQVIALCYFPTPLHMPWDNSPNFSYLGFFGRHDGNGGLRGLPTNVRIQCANTQNLAEAVDGKWGFTIRHTSNWKERVAEIRADLILARGESKKWLDFSEKLALYKAGGRQRETFLKKMFPVADDMGEKKAENQLLNREKVRTILKSETCADIADNGYGLLMATTEWSDHIRTSQTTDSYVSRQLLRVEEPKTRASRILRSMASIKI